MGSTVQCILISETLKCVYVEVGEVCTLECLKYSSLLAISLPAFIRDTLVPTRHIPAPATSLPLCFQPRAPGGVPEGSVPQSYGLSHSRGSRRAPQMPVLAWALQPLHPCQSFCWGSREGAPGYSGWSKPQRSHVRSGPAHSLWS